MSDEEYVSFEVTVAVMEQYSYKYNPDKSSDEAIIFDNFKEPFRRNMAQITIQPPSYPQEDGLMGYSFSKLVDVIACVHGMGCMGDAIAIIKMKRAAIH